MPARRVAALAVGLLVLVTAPSLALATLVPQPTYTLTASRWYIPIGTSVRVRFHAVVETNGRSAPVRDAIVALSSHRVRTDRTGYAALRLEGERRHPLRARLIVGGRTRAQALLIVG